MSGRPNMRRGSQDTGDDASRSRSRPSRKKGGDKWLTIGVTALGLIAAGTMAWMLYGPGKPAGDQDGREKNESVEKGKKKSKKKLVKNNEDAPRAKDEKRAIYACQFHTPEPGFLVLVDGVPARDAKGDKLTTPCEVGMPQGNHTLTLAREKFRDHSEEVLIVKERTFEISPVYEPFAEPSGYFASTLATADVGQPVELKNPNDGGPGWDPFLAADGLSLWFAGHKTEGKGIFVARRPSVISDFGKPEMLTKNSDRPASPSVTDDQLVVAYSVRDKAQVRSLARKEADAPFKQGPVLAFSERDGERWPSAQISPDGRTLYYLQERKGKTRALVATRKSLKKPFEDDPGELALPGGHPRLSHDGLRQHWLDGEKLWRSSRKDADTAFAKPELVCDVSLGNFTAHAGYRQFCVSADEQWLYYGDAPEETGKLYAVRIASGPQRGFAPRGKAVPQKELAANASEKSPENEPEPMAEKTERPEEPPPVDPRTVPLPYEQFRTRFDRLLAVKGFAEAEQLAAAALQDPQYEKDKEPLEWDREDAARLAKFWERVEAAVTALQPGDVFRAGGTQLEFRSYENGTIAAKIRGSDKSVSRTLDDFAPQEIVALVDKHVEKSDTSAQFEVVAFLTLFPKVSAQLFSTRLDRAGEKAKEFLERQQLRKLHLVEQEIARDNIAAASQGIDQVLFAASKLKAAAKARELRDSLPLRITWTPVGAQIWDTSVPGEYAATGGKSPQEAYLISPIEYGNFLLMLEWKTTRDTGQGGVYFRYKKAGELRKNAFKIHCAGDYAIRNNPDRFSTGSLFGIKGPTSNPVRTIGEWNTLTLRVEGDRVQATVNGVGVLDTPVSDPNIGRQGYICLDGEFGGITYRKILVYELLSRAGK